MTKLMSLKQRVGTRILKDLVRGINKFTMSYHPRTTFIKDKRRMCLQIPTIFETRGESLLSPIEFICR
jgi:hypothetical protein